MRKLCIPSVKGKRSVYKNKKWIVSIIFIALLIGLVFAISYYLFHPEKKDEFSRKTPAVFFSPHPDDETVNMGVTIAKMVTLGRPVYVVLLTHGRESGALHVINRTLKKQYMYEIYGPLSRDQLEVARVREFYNAGKALGVPRNHLFVEYLDRGKTAITYPETVEVTQKYVKMFPTADFFALSWMDLHYDHRMSGNALRHLYLTHAINHQTSRVFFFISMATRMYMNKEHARVPGVRDRATSYPVQKKVRNAISAYNEWDPKKGSFAVGFISVSRQFKRLNQEMNHYIHGIHVQNPPTLKFGD